MQIHRENIVAITIPIAISVVLMLIQYQVKDIPIYIFWIGYSICGLVILGSLFALTPFWNKIFTKNTPAVSVSMNDTIASYDNILKIKHAEPSKRPPKIFEIYLLINYVLMLAIAGLAVYLVVTEDDITFRISWGWIVFFLIFIVFPIWSLMDYIFFERKQRKLGKSRVAKENEIVLSGDINDIFNLCLRVIDKMKIKPIIMEKPKLFKGFLRSSLGNSIISVKNSQLKEQKVKIVVMSDAQWVTVKWDIFNLNQKNINTFEHLIRSESDKIKSR